MAEKKVQKKKEKKTLDKKKIFICTIIVILMIVAIVVAMVAMNKKRQKEAVKGNNIYSRVLKSGISLNTSNQILVSKTYEGLKFSNIQITKANGVSTIIADVANVSKQENGGFSVKIKFLNDKNEEMTTLTGYVNKVKPGETTELTMSSSYDFVNCYDVEISKK